MYLPYMDVRWKGCIDIGVKYSTEVFQSADIFEIQHSPLGTEKRLLTMVNIYQYININLHIQYTSSVHSICVFSMYIFVYQYMCFYQSIYQSICLFIKLSFKFSVFNFIFLSVYQFFYLMSLSLCECVSLQVSYRY